MDNSGFSCRAAIEAGHRRIPRQINRHGGSIIKCGIVEAGESRGIVHGKVHHGILPAGISHAELHGASICRHGKAASEPVIRIRAVENEIGRTAGIMRTQEDIAATCEISHIPSIAGGRQIGGGGIVSTQHGLFRTAHIRYIHRALVGIGTGLEVKRATFLYLKHGDVAAVADVGTAGKGNSVTACGIGGEAIPPAAGGGAAGAHHNGCVGTIFHGVIGIHLCQYGSGCGGGISQSVRSILHLGELRPRSHQWNRGGRHRFLRIGVLLRSSDQGGSTHCAGTQREGCNSLLFTCLDGRQVLRHGSIIPDTQRSSENMMPHRHKLPAAHLRNGSLIGKVGVVPGAHVYLRSQHDFLIAALLQIPLHIRIPHIQEIIQQVGFEMLCQIPQQAPCLRSAQAVIRFQQRFDKPLDIFLRQPGKLPISQGNFCQKTRQF